MSAWQPGDLILVSSTKPDFVAQSIISTQKEGGYYPDDARWYHAAVYTGDIGICEATRDGVGAGLLLDKTGPQAGQGTLYLFGIVF